MKRHWVITLIVAALGAMSAAPVKQWMGHRWEGTPSELYLRCEGVEGVEATFMEAVQVTDSAVVDVTLIRATDGVGWDWMCRQFRIPAAMFSDAHPSTLISYKSMPNHPEALFSSSDGRRCDWVVIALADSSLYAYHCNDTKGLPFSSLNLNNSTK